MTPEREAQMRGEFEKWWKDWWEDGDKPSESLDKGFALAGFFACARALEPMVRDGGRWRTFERALRTGRLPGAAYGRRFKIIETCPMSGDEKEFNAFVEAIDSAMSAALEDENATE